MGNGNQTMDAKDASDFELLKEPKLPRRIRFWQHQWVGIPFLMLFPILALLGIFGESSKKIETQENGLHINLESPERLRYGLQAPLNFRIENKTGQTIPQTKLVFDARYLEKFSEVKFSPEISRAYEVELKDLAPGEIREVFVEAKAKHYGWQDGNIQFKSGEQVLWQEQIRTLVFP